MSTTTTDTRGAPILVIDELGRESSFGPTPNRMTELIGGRFHSCAPSARAHMSEAMAGLGAAIFDAIDADSARNLMPQATDDDVVAKWLASISDQRDYIMACAADETIVSAFDAVGGGDAVAFIKFALESRAVSS